MVNRNIQAKMLKMKRRGRFAVFSGATTKYVSRIQEVIVQVGEEKARVERIELPAGPISLSKQVMSTGRGPDAERMATYYDRLHTFNETVPPTLGCTEPIKEIVDRYKEILDETRQMRICLENTHLGRLDLFFKTLPSGNQEWIFVDVDYSTKTFRRSRAYGSRAFAMDKLKHKRVAWVEVLTLPK